MKYTLGYCIDSKDQKLLYLRSKDMMTEYFGNPGESVRSFLQRLGIDLKDVEVTNTVMGNKYR